MQRFTLDLEPELDRVLTNLAASREMPKSEIIRRAVASYAYLSDARKAGKRIDLIDENNRTVQEVVLP